MLLRLNLSFCLASNTPVTGWSRPRNGKRPARRGKGAGRSDQIGLSKGEKVASSAPSHLACLVAVTEWSPPRMVVCVTGLEPALDGPSTSLLFGLQGFQTLGLGYKGSRLSGTPPISNDCAPRASPDWRRSRVIDALEE